MQAVTTVGLDIAKSVFQVHGHPPPAQAPVCPGIFPKAGAVRRGDRGLRNVAPLVARAQGPRPYRAADAAGLREAQKNDAADAEAICEAVTGAGANMRFVKAKTPEL